MSENKVFRVSGEVMKKQFFEAMKFSQEIKASKMEHALERVYTEIGSRHRAKRCQIIITSVDEVIPTTKGSN
jgi:large subunit ribosomal protein LX